MAPEIERVTKLDAARRQLATAIRLLFDDGDRISIHTLAAASGEILRDLGRPKGLGSMFKDSSLVKPEKQKEIRDIFSAAQNFFKHADRDPEAVHDFRPEVTPFHIFDAVELYSAVAGTLFPEAEVFRIWLLVKYPQFTLGDLRLAVAKARERGIDPDDLQTVRTALDLWKAKRAGA
jgi:hypothetical protein